MDTIANSAGESPETELGPAAAPAPEPAPEATTAHDHAPAAAIGLTVTVKAGHVQPVWAGHPWIFRQAVERIEGSAEPGGEAIVIDPNGKILGRGLYSPRSAISVRLYSHKGAQPIDAALIRERLDAAIALRRASGLPSTTQGRETSGYRLVYGEGDGLPGLIVDAFGDILVVQLGTVGLKRLQAPIVAALSEALSPRAILDRTPKALAQTEGFDVDADVRALSGEKPETLSFTELGLRHELPIALAQKTGYYFDQRPLRALVESLSRGSVVLDAFCYTGSIGLAAARGGASKVIGVDKSVPAILTAVHAAELNGASAVAEFEAIDAYAAFKRQAAQGGADVVICDPPKLAAGKKQRDKALASYRKLAAAACSAVRPGGLLAFCSCSGAIGGSDLQRCLGLGARDVGRRALVVERLFQGADHPTPAAFPEGLYLKVLVARVHPL